MNPHRFLEPEELAKLAAIVSVGTKRSSADAVAYALELWEQSQTAIERKASKEAGIPGYGSWERTLDQIAAVQQQQASIQECRANLPMPPKIPGTLDDFLRLIVKGKTPADSTKRLRDFFRHSFADKEADRDTAATNAMEKIKEGDKDRGYFTKEKWLLLGVQYQAWWKRQKSTTASNSARLRKKKLGD